MKHKTKKHIRTVLLLLTALVWQQAAAQSTGTPLEPTAKEKKVFNTILADFTTGWVTSEVTTPEGSYKWRNGQGFEISYRRLRKDGYGIGLEFAHSATNYPSRTYGGEYQLKANFYGISLLYGGFVGQKCIATVGIGAGCAYTYGSDKGSVGFGLKEAINVEYQLSPLVGIGAGLDYFMNISADQQPDGYGKKYDITGFKRLALHVGLRVYF